MPIYNGEADRRFSGASFGTDRPVSGAANLATDERFTSQRRVDDGSGDLRKELYHYGARWYLPAAGIFTQPDTIVPDAKNPQSLNRYSYGYQNPLRFVDPSGHDPLDAAWEQWFRDTYGRGPSDEDRRSELERLLAERVEEGDVDMSGTELLARYVQRLASYYKKGETAQFVKALGLLFAGIHYEGDVNRNLFATLSRDTLPIYFVMPTGLRREYLDSLHPGQDQAHHYAAVLMQSYFQSAPVAVGVNWLRDGPLSRITVGDDENFGDQELGRLAAAHGQALRGSAFVPPIAPSALADAIRRDLLGSKYAGGGGRAIHLAF